MLPTRNQHQVEGRSSPIVQGFAVPCGAAVRLPGLSLSARRGSAYVTPGARCQSPEPTNQSGYSYGPPREASARRRAASTLKFRQTLICGPYEIGPAGVAANDVHSKHMNIWRQGYQRIASATRTFRNIKRTNLETFEPLLDSLRHARSTCHDLTPPKLRQTLSPPPAAPSPAQAVASSPSSSPL